jgi:hypothetical protein
MRMIFKYFKDHLLKDNEHDDDDLEKELSAFANPKPNKRISVLPSNQAVAIKQQLREPTTRPMSDLSILSPQKHVTNQHSKELAIITERQRLFKEAALQAKKEGNVNVALVYLKHAKV